MVIFFDIRVIRGLALGLNIPVFSVIKHDESASQNVAVDVLEEVEDIDDENEKQENNENNFQGEFIKSEN